MDAASREYLEMAKRLWGPIGNGDGVPDAELKAIERKLGVKLPQFLRDVYLSTGSRDDIHQADNHLRQPGQLSVVNGVLVLLDEHQGVGGWGIRVSQLALSNPPVLVSTDETLEHWEDFDHLVDFFIGRLLWLRLRSPPWVLKRKVNGELLSKFEGLFPPLNGKGRDETGQSEGTTTRWFEGDGTLLCILRDGSSTEVQISGVDAEQLRGLGDRLDILWNDSDWAGG